jgi:hypothetical protein
MEEMRRVCVKFVHLVIVTLIGFSIGAAYAQNDVRSAPPGLWIFKILKPAGPLRRVTHDVFRFVWSRDQVLKIDSTLDGCGRGPPRPPLRRAEWLLATLRFAPNP